MSVHPAGAGDASFGLSAWFSLRGPHGECERGSVVSLGQANDYEFARTRLDYGLQVLTGLGATVDGIVGDPNPATAISELLSRKQFDEVALSTLPKSVSRWLHLDIPRQVGRKFHIPVTVIKVVSLPGPAPAEAV
jgi:hypothetical protein